MWIPTTESFLTPCYIEFEFEWGTLWSRCGSLVPVHFFLHSKAYYLTTKDHKHIYMVTTHTTLDFALISNLYNNGKKSVCLSVRNKYDVMTYDIMTHDVMTYDVVTYDVMADDVMTNNDK